MTFFAGVTTEQLSHVDLFEGLGEEALGAIAERSVFIGARPGLHIVKEGESGFDFYLIVAGTVDVVADGVTVASLGPGEVFGEMALLGGGKRSADVVATSVVSLLTMMVWDYRRTADEYPELARRLEALAASRSA
jgi:CRP-like cAMP-binding protein